MGKIEKEKSWKMLEAEAARRAEIYHEFKPGTEECEVKPLRGKRWIPMIATVIVLIGLFLWARFGIFPSYYP